MAWERVRPTLASTHRVIVPDLVGHGYSTKHDAFSMSIPDHTTVVLDLIKTLGVERITLIGQSMGGAIGLMLAGRHPDLIDRLVVVDPACYPFSLPLKGKLANLPGFGRLLMTKLYRRAVMAGFIRHDVFHDGSKVTNEQIDYVYAQFNSPVARRAIYRGMQAILDIDWLADDIRKITCPTLILWGAQDKLIPPRLGERLEQEISGARRVVVEQCGHEMMSECPEAFLEHVVPFLQQTI